MRREDAIKKLGKLLGKNLGYRVDPTAPDADERAEARDNLKLQRPIREDLAKRVEERRNAVLQADAEYQQLKAELKQVRDNCDKLLSISSHYRFTVGVSNSLFFTVHAQGDSWEEIIAKLTKEKVS